jgi:hypothetical protein
MPHSMARFFKFLLDGLTTIPTLPWMTKLHDRNPSEASTLAVRTQLTRSFAIRY